MLYVCDELRGFPYPYRKRIVEIGNVLKDKPVPAHEYDVTKMGGMEDTYRIRVTYTIGWNTQLIEIIEIEWRGRAYK